jgi:predicted nucleic acid-binding Zn ribbon protein
MNAERVRTIADAIPQVLDELGLAGRLKEYEVLEIWAAVVGERIAAVTIPQRIDDGRLFVAVLRAPWRNELLYLKSQLIDKLNAAMSGVIVKDIIFR